MVAAVSPGKMLAAALVAASFDPIGVWLAHLRGVPVPSLFGTFVIFWPNYACAAAVDHSVAFSPSCRAQAA